MRQCDRHVRGAASGTACSGTVYSMLCLTSFVNCGAGAASRPPPRDTPRTDVEEPRSVFRPAFFQKRRVPIIEEWPGGDCQVGCTPRGGRCW